MKIQAANLVKSEAPPNATRPSKVDLQSQEMKGLKADIAKAKQERHDTQERVNTVESMPKQDSARSGDTNEVFHSALDTSQPPKTTPAPAATKATENVVASTPEAPKKPTESVKPLAPIAEVKEEAKAKPESAAGKVAGNAMKNQLV